MPWLFNFLQLYQVRLFDVYIDCLFPTYGYRNCYDKSVHLTLLLSISVCRPVKHVHAIVTKLQKPVPTFLYHMKDRSS